ncbi:hypothetical protein K458DRAFT_391573 [Lentithecium fluviatile CBS 122367]|uniref:Uncharacterized protein n=1 Tax=Lentithecium fluviatile CBS 122367 TaxID=1168545 RepID=A0A6G1ITP0_9PLEO|nr:hypothetical protein K458DRAFT_391573 [Lentithecium fluviatile CBS 122367]
MAMLLEGPVDERRLGGAHATTHKAVWLYVNFMSRIEGGILSILLGFDLPLILRPCNAATYQVVGPVYAHSLMDAEALLGPLPPGWKLCYKVSQQHGYQMQRFLNKKTGAIIFEDL